MVKRQQALCQLLHRVFYNTNYTMEWNQKKKKKKFKKGIKKKNYTMEFLLLIWEYMDENPIAWYELDYLHSTMFSFRQCG